MRFAHAGRGGPVLDGVSLVLAPGEITALVGPSGAGKTTLARIVARLADPQDGTVTCGGVDLRHGIPARGARGSRVCRNAARCSPAPSRTTSGSRGPGRRRVMSRRRCARRAPRRSSPRCPAARARTSATAGGACPPASRGASRGRAPSSATPPLVVLDEPTAHLDPESAAAIEATILRLAEGRTVLLITHRAELAARCDRVVELRDGRVVPAGERAVEAAA